MAVTLLLPLPVHAEDDSGGAHEASSAERAQAWFDEGQAAYARGEYDIAANLFRAVYQATGDSAILYDLAQAERLSKHCVQALADYEEFVRTEPTSAPPDVVEKIAEMRRCAAEAEPKEPPAKPPSRAVAGAPTPKPRQDRTVWRAVAYGSIAGGAVSAALGTVSLFRAHEASAHLDELGKQGGRWDERYASYQSSVDRNNLATVGFFVASGVLTAAATSILVFRWPGPASAAKSSFAVLTPEHGLGVAYGVRF